MYNFNSVTPEMQDVIQYQQNGHSTIFCPLVKQTSQITLDGFCINLVRPSPTHLVEYRKMNYMGQMQHVKVTEKAS